MPRVWWSVKDEIACSEGAYVDSPLDAVLVVQETASLGVSVTMVNGIDVDIEIGLDVQIFFTVSVIPLAVDDVIGVQLGLGLDLSHKLIWVVVTSLDS